MLKNIIRINIINVIITYISCYKLILSFKNKRFFNELDFITRYERLTEETETTRKNV